MLSPLLSTVAEVLEALAHGRPPDRDQLLVGIVALDALQLDPVEPGDLDLGDAALELLQAALGGDLRLKDRGRFQAARLAHQVRALAARAQEPP